MFELPLPPLFNRYAIDQRELAAEYGVLLIPKRRLTCVLAASGATLDGLHLSARGHELMASTVLSVLRDHVAPPSVTTRSVTEKE